MISEPVPVPCASCGREPKINQRVVDKQWGGPERWIVGCKSCHWNRTSWWVSEVAAIEAWNRLQETREDYD